MYASGLDMQPPRSGFEAAAAAELREDDVDLLHPSRLPRSSSQIHRGDSQSDVLQSTGSGLQRSGSDLKDVVKQAIKRTSSQISRSSSAGAKEMLSAVEHTMSGDFEEAVEQAQTAAVKMQKGGLPHLLARTLICIFFLDNCLAAYQNWKFHQTDFMQMRIKSYPHRYQDPGFPFFQLFLVAPCAFLTMLGIGVRFTTAFLVMDMMRDGSGIIAEGVKGAVMHKMVLDEMAAKHLAMLGASILLLVHQFKHEAHSNAVAGLLLGEVRNRVGHLKSLVLLLSRLMMTVLFLTVGYSQVMRVLKRDYEWYAQRHYFRRDGHDNNFLLLEALLSIPFVLGYKSKKVVPALAIALIAEAFFCWSPFEHWPSVQYQSHVRNHFATNLGSAGGLLLLLSYGTGQFTIDKLLSKKD